MTDFEYKSLFCSILSKTLLDIFCKSGLSGITFFADVVLKISLFSWVLIDSFFVSILFIKSLLPIIPGVVGGLMLFKLNVLLL